MRHSFAISTVLPSERSQLEENHPCTNGRYQVSLGETPSVVLMLESIYHEYYRSKATALSLKVLQLAKEALDLSLSLTLFRDILALIQHYENKIGFVSEYLASLEELVQMAPPKPADPSPPTPSKDKSVFQKMVQVSTYESLRLSSASSLQEEIDWEVAKHREEAVSHRLDFDLPSDECSINPQAVRQYFQRRRSEEEAGGRSRPATSLHGSVNTVSSKAITQYEMQGDNVLEQSMLGLIREDYREDKRREGELGRRRTAEKSAVARFSKRMRTRLIQAKLRQKH